MADMSQQPNIFESIRSGAADVAARAAYITIQRDRIGMYARSLPREKLAAPKLDPTSHFIGPPDSTLAFFVTLDTINFGSGYFPHLNKLPGKSGYFTIATHLTEHFRQHGEIDASRLAEISAADCRAVLHQQSDNGAVDQLMEHFARALNDLGHLLLKDFAGSFTNLVAAAEHSAERLVQILSRMPMFRDVQRYHDVDVPFFKRAQLTAADLNLALPGHELGRFDDLNRLTIFADNLVPHVLRCDGILRYDESLARRIDAGELIAANSPEEIEIRAAAVHAAELIVQALTQSGHPITAMQVDYLLWNRGQEPAYKARPRHRARTIYY